MDKSDKGHKKMMKDKHNASNKSTMAKDMPMKDMDEEIGNMAGMCKMVAQKN